MRSIKLKHCGLNSNERGAVFVELTIGLPLFLFLLLVAIDLARLAVAYSSVRAATAIGVRRAAGIDRQPWQVFQLLGINAPGTSTPVASLAAHPEYRSPAGDPARYSVLAGLRGINLLFAPEARALAYANELLQRSIGGAQFPCSGRRQCFECFPVRNDGERYQNMYPQNGAEAQSMNLVGLECTYDAPLLLFGSTGRWGQRSVSVSARAFAVLKQ